MKKTGKKAAGYTPRGTRPEHCGICLHFKKPLSCERVAGEVIAMGWCKYWRKRIMS